jgi:hypothetical protein
MKMLSRATTHTADFFIACILYKDFPDINNSLLCFETVEIKIL